MLDLAAYHVSESTLAMLKENDVPVVFLGAYSFLMNGIELYWAMLKDDDLNPDCAQTSKSKFSFILTKISHFFKCSLTVDFEIPKNQKTTYYDDVPSHSCQCFQIP